MISDVPSPEKKKICHLKGFAQRIPEEHVPPDSFHEKLNEFDEIFFDGDDFSTDSFTKFIPLHIAHRTSCGSDLPTLRSFRYKESIPGLLKTWDNKVVIVEKVTGNRDEEEEEAEGLGLKVKTKINIIEAASDIVFDEEPIVCILYYHEIDREKEQSRIRGVLSKPGISYPVDDDMWRDLGCFGMHTTGACNVVAIGGGNCVLEEFRYSCSANPNINWHFWNIHRFCREGIEKEKAALHHFIDVSEYKSNLNQLI